MFSLSSREKGGGYMYKLNMLEPGTKICKVIVFLLILGIGLILFNIKKVGIVILIIAVMLFILLIILLAIEQHQDNILYLEAKRNDPEIK